MITVYKYFFFFQLFIFFHLFFVLYKFWLYEMIMSPIVEKMSWIHLSCGIYKVTT